MKNLTIIALLIVSLSSCTVAFTEAVRSKVESQGLDLKKIQFYNSSGITLRRVLTSSEAKVASGKVKIQNGEFVEIININPKTPGRCEIFGNDFLEVSFEEGENKSIKFISDNINSSYSKYFFKPGDCQEIYKGPTHGPWPGSKIASTNKCKVVYDNKEYSAEFNATSSLLIKKSQVNNRQVTTHTVPGIKVE